MRLSDEPVRPLVPRPKGLQPPASPATAVLPSPTTPRSILKMGDSSGLIHKSEPSTSTVQSSTEGSPLRKTKSVGQKIIDRSQHKTPKVTGARKVKEGVFFAFVLLPLSCWYTRGGKRLSRSDDFDDEPFRPTHQLARRSSVSTAPGQQQQRRGSVSVPGLMQSPGPRR